MSKISHFLHFTFFLNGVYILIHLNCGFKTHQTHKNAGITIPYQQEWEESISFNAVQKESLSPQDGDIITIVVLNFIRHKGLFR